MTRDSGYAQEVQSVVSVLIVDDHPVVREGLKAMLHAPDIEIVGEATTGRDAVQRARELSPDVVLMDVAMPDMDGLDATRALKSQSPETAVIVITGVEDRGYLRRAIESGAVGYLVKGMPREVLLRAVRVVKDGGSLVDARMLAEAFRDDVEQQPASEAQIAIARLSPRELEVLRLLARGLTNKEIALEMSYSVGTVKNVVQRIMEKLGVSDRTQAAVFAVRGGFDLE